MEERKVNLQYIVYLPYMLGDLSAPLGGCARIVTNVLFDTVWYLST
jgi:hypothetical protein